MSYNFDVVHDRRHSDSGKWNKYPADVLPMWVADMDFASPQPVIDALRGRVEHGIFGYPGGIAEAEGLGELRRAAVTWVLERHAWQVQPGHLVFLPGVVTAFNLACHAFAASGGGVLVQPPVYEPILHAAKNTGALSQEAVLLRLPDGAYEIDFDALAARITPQTRLFLLCNPHNPVGRVFRRQELERLAEICLRRGLVICSDEIHADLVYPPHRHTPIASLDPEIARSTITLMAPTKTFNLAGLQCSYAIISNASLLRRYRKAAQGLVGWVNVMGLTAAQAAYTAGLDWLEQLLPYLQANRDLLQDFVTRELLGVSMAKPEGTYLAWLDFSACPHPQAAADPFRFFLERAGVAFEDGKKFGPGGEGRVRLNFGCPRPLLLEALQRMKDALLQ